MCSAYYNQDVQNALFQTFSGVKLYEVGHLKHYANVMSLKHSL